MGNKTVEQAIREQLVTEIEEDLNKFLDFKTDGEWSHHRDPRKLDHYLNTWIEATDNVLDTIWPERPTH